MNIRVDQLQRARSVPGAAWEWVCMHLASKAWLTDRVWRSFDTKLHASDQITLNERFHITLIQELTSYWFQMGVYPEILH